MGSPDLRGRQVYRHAGVPELGKPLSHEGHPPTPAASAVLDEDETWASFANAAEHLEPESGLWVSEALSSSSHRETSARWGACKDIDAQEIGATRFFDVFRDPFVEAMLDQDLPAPRIFLDRQREPIDEPRRVERRAPRAEASREELSADDVLADHWHTVQVRSC